MKRILAAVFCFLALTMPVFASGNTLELRATVDSRGDCQVSAQLSLDIPQPVTELVLPLGQGAKAAQVNGAPVDIRKVDGVPCVRLTNETGFSGSLQLALSYTLADCVSADTDWALVLPILAEGLPYSMDSIRFEITLPGAFDALPGFTSGYYGDDVDNYMTVSVKDGVITGSVDTPLRDRERLTMTLATDPAMFPRVNEAGRFYPVARLCVLVCALLALLYWLIFLRWRPFRVLRQTQPPVGLTPGEAACKLLADSPDLALMVLSWAQLGYLTIHLSQDLTVTLHKRMDMGNERSEYENHIFQSVFGHGQVANTASRAFQSLRAQVDHSRPRVRGLFRRRGGRVLWMRLLGALAGVFAGAAVGDLLAPPNAGRIFLVLLAALLGGLAAWRIQPVFHGILSRNRRECITAGVCAALFLTLGLVAGCLGTALGCCLAQAAAGLLTLFGGRRSDTGRQMVQSILGFRRYLRTVSRKELARIMEQRPGYYYDLAPYALALGVDRQFAGQFETLRLPDCPWLVTDVPQGNRAPEWYPVLRQTAQALRGKYLQSRTWRSRLPI